MVSNAFSTLAHGDVVEMDHYPQDRKAGDLRQFIYWLNNELKNYKTSAPHGGSLKRRSTHFRLTDRGLEAVQYQNRSKGRENFA